LIPLKIISEECCKLADDFIPELVDALASRMDPQVVCAVSGLCNSVRIDEMLGEMKEIDSGRTTTREPFDLNTDSCPKCSHFLGKAVSSLKRLPKEALLTKMLQVEYTCLFYVLLFLLYLYT
jgi:saposin